jgi:phospholipase C
MTVTDPQIAQMMSLFTYDTNNPSCYTFTNYESNQTTTPIVPPISMTVNYPQVTIPATIAGAISVPVLNYTVKIQATIPATGVYQWGTLTLTINHECSAATFISIPSTQNVIYIIGGA